MQVQFESAVTEDQARAEMMMAIERAGDGDITSISSMTAVADIFSNPKGENALVRTCLLYTSDAADE